MVNRAEDFLHVYWAHDSRPDRAEGPLHVQESKLDRAEGPLYVQRTRLTVQRVGLTVQRKCRPAPKVGTQYVYVEWSKKINILGPNSTIEYAMRRDTAAPRFEHVPFRGMRLLEVDCVVQDETSSLMF